jgi:RHS repeat-associated protein
MPILGIEAGREFRMLSRFPVNAQSCTGMLLPLRLVLMAILFGACAAGFFVGVCFGADKNGVSPNTISLPSGPGSIEGLGESFQPTLNTGTAKYRVALTVPPGTAGHKPDLALTYDGGGSNGPLGIGWSLGIPFVQRQTDKGIPRYVDTANGVDDDLDGVIDNPQEMDVFINDAREELVPTAEGFYLCENEGAFVRYARIGNHWEGTLPDGTTMEFGLTSLGRIMDAATGRVFTWLLEKMTDTNRNTIVFTYRTYAGDQNRNQRYLAQVKYGPGAPPWVNFHFVVFGYESRSDWFEDCRPGFAVRTGVRLKRITIGTQGPALEGHASGDFNGDGVGDYLNRRYVLSYEAHPHWSLLTSLTWIGADNKSSYPPMRLGYTVANPPATMPAEGEIIGAVNAPAYVMDNELVDLADLNGDGLPDILKTERFGGAHTAYLNRGESTDGGSKSITWGPGAEVSSADGLAWNINLQDTTPAVAHLADMDGDGLADLVYKAGTDVYYFTNQGKIAWGSRLVMNVDSSESAPPSPFAVDNVKTADLDFDKRMDIIQSISTGGSADYRIWFNLGNQRYSRSVTVSQDFGYMLSDTGVHIADFNGDRVPDIVRVRPTGLEVTAGLGYGNFAPMVFVPIPDYTLDVEQPGQVERARLEDITGDGLVDLIIERAAPGQVWYWINLGNYALDNRRVITGMPTGLGTNPAIRWADLNGNGTTDLVYADSYAEPRLQTVDIGELVGCVPSPNMLVSIDNGIGRKITIEYATSTKYILEDLENGHIWPQALPFPVNVVSMVRINDSLGNVYTTAYQYHDGFYDGMEKEFRGFGAVEIKELGDTTVPDLITAHTFDIGAHEKALKGKALWIEARDANNKVFHRIHNIWSTKILFQNANGDGRSVTFPFVKSRVRDIIEKGNGNPVQVQWEYEYDNYGNVVRQIEYGRMDPGWDDERITEMAFTSGYESGRNRWILRQLVLQTVTDESGTRAAQRRNYYDGSLELGEVSKGNLTRTEDWVSADSYVIAGRNDVDVYGNVVASFDPLFGQEAGHYREIVYDGVFHTYPVSEAISTGNDQVPMLNFSATYDFGFGVMTSSSEFNGHKTTYEYDAFRRLISVTKPPDTQPTLGYGYVLAYDLGEGRTVNWVETTQPDGSPGDGLLHVRAFYDGLGRKIMTRSESENPQQVLVAGAVQFNGRMMPWRSFIPYFETGNLDYTGISPEAAFTEYLHDGLGREVRVNRPAVAGTSAFGTTEYAPFARTVRDENNTDPHSPHFGGAMRFVEDGLPDREGNGRLRMKYELVKISDNGEVASEPVQWLTAYTYDLLDKLTSVTDSQGNKRIFTYDGLGRMTSVNDPNRGVTSYAYDAASNMTETIDAKAQRIVYAYDGANRLLSEDYLDEGSSFSAGRAPDVSYFYDIPAGAVDAGDGTTKAALNTKGSLAWVRDLSGEEHTSYDERGRLSWVVKRVKAPLTNLLVSYSVNFTFDSLDRLTSLRYPDNDLVRYEYNARGHLERIYGGGGKMVVSNINYDASDQITLCQFGNGISTRREYDPRLRLTLLETYKNSDPSGPILSYGYTYDGGSNIRKIRDGRPERVIPAGDLRRNTQVFEYDDLYRLLSVAYSFSALSQADREDGRIDYRYDRIGNMLSKTSDIVHQKDGLSVTNIGQMTYGGAGGRFNRIGRQSGSPAGPNALTTTDNAVDERIIEYDDNGNVLDVNGNILIWDFKDRLVKFEKGGLTADYSYDYMNRRILKKASSNTEGQTGAFVRRTRVTTYPFDYFEIRESQPIKYVYFEGSRIARVTGTLDSGVARVQQAILYTGWNLIAAAVASQNGLVGTSGIDAIYRWNGSSKNWEEISSSSPLAQGDILWVLVSQPAILTMKGAYHDPATQYSLENGNFYGISGLEEMALYNLSPSSSAWSFDSLDKKWLPLFSSELAFLSEAGVRISAGQVVYVKGEGAKKVGVSNHSANILYYHKDHLSSSTVLTNDQGDIHFEQNYYPFGENRVTVNNQIHEESYGFIDKEQDAESGMHYFGSRYFSAALGRFLSVEPLISNPDAFRKQSFSVHPYAYSRNNPIGFSDTNGLEEGPYYEKYRTPGESVRSAVKKMHEDAMSQNDRNKSKQLLDRQPGRKMTTEDGQIIGLTEEGYMYMGGGEDNIKDVTIDASDAEVPFAGSLASDAQGSKDAKKAVKDLEKEIKAKAERPAPPNATPRATPQTKPTAKPSVPAGPTSSKSAGAAKGKQDVCVGMCHEVLPLATVDPDYGYYGSFTECVEYKND